MVKVEAGINKSLNEVWDFFLNPGNWGKWWPRGIKKIIPGWEEDAVIYWSDGSECNVWSITPKKIVQFNTQWMRTTFKFNAADEGMIMQIKLDARWEKGFSGRGIAERTELAGALSKFKDYVEKGK
ncbi:MAG: hypothetical protein AB1498_12765 [bacterium]